MTATKKRQGQASGLPYPGRVGHYADEPSYGLLMRTAHHNGIYRYYTVFERYGVYGGMSVSAVDPSEIARVCKAEPTAVVRASPVVTPGSVSLLGQVVVRDHFSAQTRRWCPECLKEHGYHRAWWDVVVVTACPFHGVEIVTRCGCDQPLQWRNHSLTVCRRGHRLTDVAPTTVPAEDLAADDYIVARLTGGEHPPVPLLDDLPLGEAIQAMERVGKAAFNEDLGVVAARREAGQRRLLVEGFRVFEGFPNSFGGLLDRIMSKQDDRKGRWGIARAYGEFYIWITRMPDDALGKALKLELERHATQNVTLKTGQKIRGQSIEEEGLTLLQASAQVGISHERFRRIAVELGYIAKQKIQGKPFRLNPEMVASIAERLKDHKDLERLAEELGTAPQSLRAFIDAGLLEHLVKAHGEGATNRWIFPKDAAARLLARLDDVAIDAVPDPSLAPIPRAAQISYTNSAAVVGLILAGKVKIEAVDRSATGIQRYFVSKVAVRKAKRRDQVIGNTLTEALDKLGIDNESATDFVRKGIIKSEKWGRIILITDEEIERFRATYVTVPELSERFQLGGHSGWAIKKLSAMGLEPVCTRPPYFRVLYDRKEALAVLGPGIRQAG